MKNQFINVALNYFERFNSNPEIIKQYPNPDTEIIIVIPCYMEEDIISTIKSIFDSKDLNCSVEVLIIINSSENDPDSVIEFNYNTYKELQAFSQQNKSKISNIKLFPVLLENINKKHAGVGYARKIGMDEAIRRLKKQNRQDGIIVSLDADCTINNKYLSKLKKSFDKDKTQGACIPQFQHNFASNSFDDKTNTAAKTYELYLRYFRLSLKYTGFPYSYHTIGSCLAVTASTYIRAGGMSRRQGGEDFYFIHKTAPLTKIGLINEIMVYPSPRPSDRVPFGTGPAVSKIISEKKYDVYNFNAFKSIQSFFKLFPFLYKDYKSHIADIPVEIRTFAGEKHLTDLILECLKNTNSLSAFEKRMFTKFNAFFIIKYLNSLDYNSDYPPQDVLIASELLLNQYSITCRNPTLTNLYNCMLELDLA